MPKKPEKSSFRPDRSACRAGRARRNKPLPPEATIEVTRVTAAAWVKTALSRSRWRQQHLNQLRRNQSHDDARQDRGSYITQQDRSRNSTGLVKFNDSLKIGAGEGIRTLDPDLGKVVLYH
jgi:hypothetical protein